MELLTTPLSLIILLPVAAGLALLAVPAEKDGALKALALAAALLIFLVSLKLYTGFDPAQAAMQFQFSRIWLPSFGISYFLGIDGISLLMIMLTTLLMPVAVLASFNYIKESRRGYYRSEEHT